MATVLIPLAQGCEELEAVTLIDILRRAEIEVTVAGLDDQPVVASRGVVLVPDTDLDSALKNDYDMIVLPGGLEGTENLNKDARIHSRLKQMHSQGQYTAAICAAPRVLAEAGLLANKQATSYPTVLEQLNIPDITYIDAPIIEDDKVITSRGPGTALDFALHLVERLVGQEVRQQVEAGLVR